MGEHAARAPGYRGDVKWVHQRASASNLPKKDRLRLAWGEFKAMSDEQQSQMLEEFKPSGEDRSEDSQPEINVDLGTEWDWAWDSRDSGHPLTPEMARVWKKQEGANNCYCSKIGKHLYRNRENVFIKDENVIPERKVFTIRLSCSQRHYGLCARRDADVYHVALTIAKSFEHYFKKSHLRRFWQVGYRKDVFGECEEDLVLQFSYIRERRHHAQITHVFLAAC